MKVLHGFKMSNSVLFTVCCFGLITNVLSSAFTKNEELELDKYIDSFLSCRDVPGLGIAVVKNGESFSKGYGMADIENKVPANNSTIFCLGSVTKSMTTMLLAKLISKKENKLSWTSKVKDFLGPEYSFNKDCITDHVTLADILSHRTGLSTADLLLQSRVPTSVTREHTMKNLEYLTSTYDFRDTFYYNNLVYVLAAHVAEKVTGQSWEQLMEDELFTPLNMTSTVLLDTHFTETLAVPYIKDRNQTMKLSNQELYHIHPFGPAGSVCSSSDDMTKWLKLITSKGKAENGESLILDYIMARQWHPVSTLTPLWAMAFSLSSNFPVTFDSYAYGYGWFVSYYRGYKLMHHSGSLYGYSSKIAYLPAIDSAFVFFNNGPGEIEFDATIDPVFYFLLDLVIGEQPWLNETTVCTYPMPWKVGRGRKKGDTRTTNKRSDIKNIDRYEGSYSNPLYGDVTLTKADDKLLIKYGMLLEGTVLSDFSVSLQGPLEDVYFNAIYLSFNDLKTDNTFGTLCMNAGIESYKFKRDIDSTNKASGFTRGLSVSACIIILHWSIN